jgi:aminopeptidase N
LVCAHAAHEAEIVLLERLMAQALRVVDVYGDPANRPASRRQIAAASRRGFAQADHGTDVQLAWARGIIAASDSASDLAEIKAWLEVDETAGLKVDTDLRWAIVARLAAAGAVGQAEIDAEHERDPSDIGRRRSLGSRASRPLEEAKREAWDLLTGSVQLPLQDALSIAAGFSQPDQIELLEPYIEEYRTAVPQIWATQDAESAVAYTHALYPEYIVSEAVLDMADSLLAGEIPAPAKRIISEAKDQTLRSARARAVDTAASEEPVPH